MPAKYRKLTPSQLLTTARAVTAAARGIVDMASQMRADAARGPISKEAQALESHHLTHEAKELNLAACAVFDLTAQLREELYLVAKETKRAKRQQRKEAPKCGAWKATGGRCATRLEPGQFRCPLHATAVLRTNRLKRARATKRSQAPEAANDEATPRQESIAKNGTGGDR